MPSVNSISDGIRWLVYRGIELFFWLLVIAVFGGVLLLDWR